MQLLSFFTTVHVDFWGLLFLRIVWTGIMLLLGCAMIGIGNIEKHRKRAWAIGGLFLIVVDAPLTLIYPIQTYLSSMAVIVAALAIAILACCLYGLGRALRWLLPRATSAIRQLREGAWAFSSSSLTVSLRAIRGLAKLTVIGVRIAITGG